MLKFTSAKQTARLSSKTMNKSVLIITSHYPPNIGGVESHLQALVEGLGKRGWGVIISTYQPLASNMRVSKIEKEKALLIYRMPWLGFNLVHLLFRYPFLEFLYLFPGLFLISLLVLINHYKRIQVIHCQGLVPTVVGFALGKLFSKKVIGSTHNLYFFPKKGMYKFFSKFIFSSVDQVLTPTKVAKKELERIGVPSSNIKVFRYWVDLKKFAPINKIIAKRKLRWRGFNIIFVGRLIETKGIAVLLQVIQNIKLDVRFIIAGIGPLESEVRDKEKKYSNLKYLGRIDNKNLPIYYSAADLVVVPSLVDEGFGFVVMEAMACGTPVLASNKGGLSEAVSNQTGMLFEPNAIQLAKTLKYLFTHKRILREMTNSCRKYALNNFSGVNIDDILRTYE